MTKVQVLPMRLVLTLLPAEVRIAPPVTETVLMLAGRVRLNWRLATEVVPGSKVMGRFTAVPACPEALPTVKEGCTAQAPVARKQPAIKMRHLRSRDTRT